MSFYFLTDQVSLPWNILLYNLRLTINDASLLVCNGTNYLNLFHPVVVCSRRHGNQPTAGPCSDVSIVLHLINYAHTNAMRWRLQCSHGKINNVGVLQSSRTCTQCHTLVMVVVGNLTRWRDWQLVSLHSLHGRLGLAFELDAKIRSSCITPWHHQWRDASSALLYVHRGP